MRNYVDILNCCMCLHYNIDSFFLLEDDIYTSCSIERPMKFHMKSRIVK